MASTRETGHAINVANFKKLIDRVKTYLKYNPFVENLTIVKLEEQHLAADLLIKSVIAKKELYNKAVNIRFVAFKNLKYLSTQLKNSLSITQADEKTKEDFEEYHRKMKGARAKTIKDELISNDDLGEKSEEAEKKKISVSQQSYVNLAEHFSGEIEVLRNVSDFLPNEDELKLANLEILHTSLKANNDMVFNSYLSVDTIRLNRTTALYDELEGLVKTAKKIKSYVLSVYTASSEEYKKANSIKFRTIIA